MDDAPDLPAPLWRRLAWFLALWAGNVLALGIVAALLRAWLTAG